MARADSPPAWPGVRRFRVESHREECQDTASLVLVPEDGVAPPPFAPGQYVTLVLHLPELAGGSGPPHATAATARCYSLSDAPNGRSYRITVKAIGRASGFLVRTVQPGDALDLRAPSGSFVLDPDAAGPAVLVGAGIGLTPFASMLAAIAAGGTRRPVHVFLGLRSGAERALAPELERAASTPGVRLHVAYSAPRVVDCEGLDHELRGRLSVDVLKRLLPESDRPYEFLLCGPPTFMSAIAGGLAELGVPPSAIRVEVFGPASVRRVTTTRRAQRGRIAVRFARSGKEAAWNPTVESLLALAERHGVPIPWACGAGRCGTCMVPLLAGDVGYVVEPQFGALRPGMCLPCIAQPDTSVVLDV